MVDPKHDAAGELNEAQLEDAAGAGIPVSGQNAASHASASEQLRDSDAAGSSGALADPPVKDPKEPDPWKNKPT